MRALSLLPGGDASTSTSAAATSTSSAASASAPKAKRQKTKKAVDLLSRSQPIATPRPVGGSAAPRVGPALRCGALVCDDDELALMAQRLIDSWVGQFCTRAGELILILITADIWSESC